jgi:hypothetical protein
MLNTDPAEPIDKIDPVEPMERIEPEDPNDQRLEGRPTAPSWRGSERSR